MADDAKSLAELLAELAEVQQRLLELSSDAFAERFELQKRQDALREQTARFAHDWDLDRPSEDLLTELASLRERLGRLDRQKIDVVTQGGAGTAAPAGDGWGRCSSIKPWVPRRGPVSCMRGSGVSRRSSPTGASTLMASEERRGMRVHRDGGDGCGSRAPSREPIPGVRRILG